LIIYKERWLLCTLDFPNLYLIINRQNFRLFFRPVHSICPTVGPLARVRSCFIAASPLVASRPLLYLAHTPAGAAQATMGTAALAQAAASRAALEEA
jgi:hypothetical protein